MPWKSVEASTHVINQVRGQSGGKLDLIAQMLRTASIEVLGQRIDLGLGEPESLPHILEDRSGSIGDDVRHHRGALSAVASIAILDDLLASLRLEIDVDIGRPTSLG